MDNQDINLRHIAIIFIPLQLSPIIQPLSYDFLSKNKIIPKESDFEVQPGVSFVALPVSQTVFFNGFTVISEPARVVFQFSKSIATESEQKYCLKLLKDIPLKCIQHEAFKNMKYSAIGINFQCIRPNLKFESCIDKCIKKESSYFKVSDHQQASPNSISFSYKDETENYEKIVNITVKKILTTGDSIFEVNVHHPRPEYNTNEIIKSIESNYETLKKFIRQL